MTKCRPLVRLLLAALDELGIKMLSGDRDDGSLAYVQLDFETDEDFERVVSEIRAPAPKQVTVPSSPLRSGATWRKSIVKFAGLELTLASPHRQLEQSATELGGGTP